MSGGSIDRRLWGTPLESVTPEERFTWACDIAEGMCFIHSKGFAHRDLKSSNVLFDAATTRAKVSDFGMARQIASTRGVGALYMGLTFKVAHIGGTNHRAVVLIMPSMTCTGLRQYYGPNGSGHIPSRTFWRSIHAQKLHVAVCNAE